MKNLTIKTYDKTAKRFADTHWDTAFWAMQYKDFSLLLRGGRVLDAGCGPGRDTAYFVAKGYDVIGVDASKGMLAEAAKRVPGAEFVRMDLADTAFKQQQFDGIWCCASALHLNRDQCVSALAEFARVLKKDGVLFVSLKQGSGSKLVADDEGNQRFFQYYSETSAKRLVRSQFDVVRSYLFRHSPADNTTWISIFARKRSL